jgi:hypothetical protein
MIIRILSFIALGTLLASFGFFAPEISLTTKLPSAVGSFSVKPADQSVVCPGPLIRSGGESGTKLGVFDQIGKANLIASTNAQATLVLEEIDSADSELLPLPAQRSFISRSVESSLELRLTETDQSLLQGSVSLTASQSQSIQSPSLDGLAASNCIAPSNDFVLVGGSTAIGREAILLLSNPSRIDATADIRIFTDLGEVEVSGLSGISVVANSTTLISLASFAPTVSQFAVSVQSQGAKLAGWIQQKSIRGTQPAGVDYVIPNPNASESVVIPGLVIRGTKTLNQIIRAEEDSDAGHALRIFAPTGALITVQITPADPEAFGAVFIAEVEAGTVQDFPIGELKDGDYSVFISSDRPIHAAVRVGRADPGDSPPLDFAWLNPSEAISETRAVTAAREGENVLMVANSSSTEQSAILVDLESGARRTLLIPASGTLSVLVNGSFSIESDSEVYANLILLRDGKISDLAVLDAKNLGSAVSVRFR